jgi:hypothetical protein
VQVAIKQQVEETKTTFKPHEVEQMTAQDIRKKQMGSQM